MKTVADFPLVEKAFALWQKTKARITDRLRQLDQIHSGALDRKADRHRQAEALLEGKPMVDEDAERRQTLAGIHKELVVLPASAALARSPRPHRCRSGWPASCTPARTRRRMPSWPITSDVPTTPSITRSAPPGWVLPTTRCRRSTPNYG